MPSADTIRRVFESLNRRAFSAAFATWIGMLTTKKEGDTISIDGKALRRSGKATSGLLEMLDLRGKTVTVDAASAQRNIAAQVLAQGGDYVMAVRGNQPSLEETIVSHLAPHIDGEVLAPGLDRHVEYEDGHGRVTERTIVTRSVESLGIATKWTGAETIAYVRCRRIEHDKASEEWRPYLSSRDDLGAKELGALIRSHWSVENNLHWQLDVSFREDESRVRDRNAADNLSFIRSLALGMLKRETTYQRGINAKRRKAFKSHQYLLRVLNVGGSS